jgi:uncharacterized protein YutE (UPF0331/DUF86 family)
MVVRDVIASKVEVVEDRVRRLRLYGKGLTFDSYLSDTKTKDAVERNLQVALQACIDIGKIIVKAEGYRQPEDNKGVFVVLAENRIITDASLSFLLPMAGTRNVLVHGYDKVDDATVFGVVQKRLSELEQFLRDVKMNYLDVPPRAKRG